MLSTMRLWSARQLFIVLLALAASVGISLSAVQATDMTVKMTMASNIGAAADGDCHGCSTGGDGGAKAMPCSPVCVTPGLAALPQTPAASLAPASRLSPPQHRLLVGRDFALDPSPPKPPDLA